MHDTSTLKMLGLLSVIIFATSFLGGCVTAKQKQLDSGLKPLTTEDFQRLLSHPIEATYFNQKKNVDIMVNYFPNGTQKFNTSNRSDTGTWRIADGEYCSKWKETRNGAESCSTWFKTSEKTYDIYDRDGTKSGVLTIK